MTYPKVVYIEAVLMDNNEVIAHGNTLGFINKEQKGLVENEATKLTKGHEVIVALGEHTA